MVARICAPPCSGERDTGRSRLKNVMAHAQKPDFVFRRNGRFHLNRRGASVQSTTGSQGVHISGSNAGYTMFRDSVKGTGYSILQFPLHIHPPPPAVRHRVPSHFNWSLPPGRNPQPRLTMPGFKPPTVQPAAQSHIPTVMSTA
jgi:hypothetical protein